VYDFTVLELEGDIGARFLVQFEFKIDLDEWFERVFSPLDHGHALLNLFFSYSFFF